MRSRRTTDYVYDRRTMLQNPEAAFERLRADGDVVWSATMRRWLVVSKAAAQAALAHPSLHVYDLFRNFDGIQRRTGVDLAALSRICGWIPFLMDGPRHAILRALFARILAEIREPYLEALEAASRDLLAAIAQRGGGDLARDYAERLHSEAIGRMLGFPAEARKWIAEMSSSQGSIDFAASVTEMRDASRRAGALLARLEQLVAADAAHPFMARIGAHLLGAGLDDNKQTRIECLTTLLLLGRDTIGGTLSLGLAHMLDARGGELSPADWHDGERLSGIGDELIRMSSTVQISIRVAAEDLTLDGQHIGSGDMLMIFLPAANRDPVAFVAPDRMDARNAPHVAFGGGRHLCVGMALSRRIVAMALDHIAVLGTMRALPGRVFDESRNTRKYLCLPIALGAEK